MSTDNSEDEVVSSDFENELEELFKSRYTDEDKEYQEVVAQETAPPPTVIPWHTKSKRNYDWSGYHGRDRRGWHGGRGGGGGGYRDRGYHDRGGNYYDRNSGGYRNYHNRNDGYHDRGGNYRDRSGGYHNYGGSGGGYHGGGGGGGGYHGGRNHGGGGGYRGGYQNHNQYQARQYYNRDRYNPYQRN
ncbi:TATA-binding protein-associated factor 2N [Octopus vulgaris]|uniref:TATA-binding protein-associated factor 2N n=1 Tax=Octopus vulgaris TaxID=6645 RepID=A0AA36BL63_OCTVU|nr:TATA-binding protein-associated factor 2N [Octopus vulgaris]